LATVLTAAAPMWASADPGDSIQGGCQYGPNLNSPLLTQGENIGPLLVNAFMTKSNNMPDAAAVVECEIRVNGFPAPNTQLTVSTNAVGVAQGQLLADWDNGAGTSPSELCENDTWGDGDTSGWYCVPI